MNRNETNADGIVIDDLVEQLKDTSIMDDDKVRVLECLQERLGLHVQPAAPAPAPAAPADAVQAEPCFSSVPAGKPSDGGTLLDGVLGLSGFWQEGAVRAICSGRLKPGDAMALATAIENACDGTPRVFTGAELRQFKNLLAETAGQCGWDAACALELVLCNPRGEGRRQAAERLKRLAEESV